MKTGCRCFTLVELLVVIAIIAVLAGLLLPALAGAREHAKRTRAQTEMKLLQTAIAMYESDYGVLPMDGIERVLDSDEYTDLICTLQNVKITGHDCGNARGKRYLDIATEQGEGRFRDPWSTASNLQSYRIALDLDYDGYVEAWCGASPPSTPDDDDGPYEKVYNRVVIWSKGKDHKNNAGMQTVPNSSESDVNSWRQ